MSVCFTQEEFNEKAMELVKLSEKVNDRWRIEQKEQILFLVKNDKIVIDAESDNGEVDDDPSVIQAKGEVLSIEYHVLLHPSYQVPTFYFNAYKHDRLVDLNDVSKLFNEEYDKSQFEVHNIISQADHPILFRPFFIIHPCKIGEVLANFPETKNFILTFLSIFGPSIRLKMSTDYEKFI